MLPLQEARSFRPVYSDKRTLHYAKQRQVKGLSLTCA